MPAGRRLARARTRGPAAPEHPHGARGNGARQGRDLARRGRRDGGADVRLRVQGEHTPGVAVEYPGTAISSRTGTPTLMPLPASRRDTRPEAATDPVDGGLITGEDGRPSFGTVGLADGAARSSAA